MSAISEMLDGWIDTELKEQKGKLDRLLKAEQFNSIKKYHNIVAMRKELVSVCEKYKKEDNK
jgi:hypothetical protein